MDQCTSTSTIFYTRLGIGVFDPQWWDYRLRLFEAVTYPSVARHVRSGAEWVWFVDSDMPTEYRDKLDQLAAEVPGVHLLEVQFYFDISPVLQEFVAARGKTVTLVRIDDDDALSADFLDCAAEVREGIEGPSLVCLTRGMEVSLPDWKGHPYGWLWGSCNTVYHGPIDFVATYAVLGHHRVTAWAAKQGIPQVESDAGEPAFMYSRHKQSDSSFGTTRRSVLDAPKVRTLRDEDIARFGIDASKCLDWRKFARTAPATRGKKVWALGADILAEASRPGADRESLKKDLIAAKTLFLKVV